jgi:hypothetical protein
MEYTPRQCQAFAFIADKRRQRELSEALEVSALGARGDQKQILARQREWES